MKATVFKIFPLSSLLFAVLFSSPSPAKAQQQIGSVGLQDATVAGALEVTNGRAILVGNATVTARDHTAEVALSRGGSVHVCSTSGLHVTAGKGELGAAPLMLALDRGAIEVQMAAITRDVVTTPDLRFTVGSDGPLDLQLRVTKNGDTCVDNRGANAPILHIADQFGEANYQLQAGQHVLFEHASLKEVVDRERSSCGCPPEPGMSIADALMTPGASETPAAKKAAEEHPFPAAISADLAPPAASPASAATPPGVIHSQVSATLSSDGAPDSLTPTASSSSTETPAPQPSTAAPVSSTAAASSTTQPPPPKGIFHSVGQFFRRIFGGS